MILADKKRANSIAEYIIYMYQTEDLIRAYELDIERINRDLISLLPGNGSEKTAVKQWYQSIIDALKEEQIENVGHLNELKLINNDLMALYRSLIEKDVTFQEIANNAQYLFNKTPSLNEVEVCLNGMYAYLILKTGDLPVPEITKKSAEIYGEVLSYLSYKYAQPEYLSKN